MTNGNRNSHKNYIGPLVMLALTALLGIVLVSFGNGSYGKPAGGRDAGPAAETLPHESAEIHTGVGGRVPAVPEGGLRIAVASDLHLDPDNTDRSGFQVQAGYNLELTDALLRDVRERGSTVLLLTGDLVNGGKPHRHEVLTEKLRQAEAGGLQIFVLPGNHDLAPVSQTEFAGYYAEFGFSEAFSRDRSSLSYSVLLDRLMLIMLDTAGYRTGAIDLPGAPERMDNEAFLSSGTLTWVEEQLKAAREQGLPVLCAGHYNLLTSISRERGSGFYLENGDRLAALLRRYGVPLYLSGHMHIQTVMQEEGLTELLTEYLLSYPTGYSLLDVTENDLRFTPARVDVEGWAREAGVTDPVLLRFSAWQEENLYRYCRDAVAAMSARNPLREDELEDAAKFFNAVMLSYWDGTLSQKRDMLETMPGCRPFFRCAEGYSYGWWLQELMDSASPLLQGFSLSWGGTRAAG